MNVCTLSNDCYNTLTSLQDLASTYGIYGGQKYPETGFPLSTSIFPCKYGFYVGQNDTEAGFPQRSSVFPCQHGIYVGQNGTETGFPPSTSVFPSESDWEGGVFVVDKMILEQISVRVLRFSSVSIIPRELRTLSFIYQRCCVVVKGDIIVK
jgi:hypothetical protein